ncbi:bifunctional diaminohydroxyphosphoribosylaminopyrimidine deaminase/5-amino-6-(5-phosphoribosylamino)uracil reductase RibD [bacterium]|nr:bifunctional diaminohydroxyphosphoribosylaminopyrimidine deaminase/5-amino-6-(5-phosphoribosylamino)uracil reductase RibD [bacterium]
MNMSVAKSMMQRAIKVSRQCKNSVYPNPKVGAVIFDDEGTILAEGFTQKYGGPHAEVVALSKLDNRASGLNMAVTLEPCNHYGKTPPCSVAIHSAGIKQVFIAKKEENSKAKNGATWLQENDVPVVFMDEYADDVVEINRFFFKNIRKKRVWVTVKIAQSQDGFIAAQKGFQTHISSPESDVFVHTLRAEHQAIAVGAHTLTIDNPLLTVRLVSGANPLPVIYSASLQLPENARLYTSNPLVFTEKVEDAAYLIKQGCTVESLVADKIQNTLELLLNKYNKNAILVEGGAKLIHSFLTQNLVDELVVITAPIFLKKGYSIDINRMIDSSWKMENSFDCGEDKIERYRKIHS